MTKALVNGAHTAGKTRAAAPRAAREALSPHARLSFGQQEQNARDHADRLLPLLVEVNELLNILPLLRFVH